MPSLSDEKNQNDLIRTEGRVAFQRNLEFVEFQVEFWKFTHVTKCLFVPSFFGKKFQWSNKS